MPFVRATKAFGILITGLLVTAAVQLPPTPPGGRLPRAGATSSATQVISPVAVMTWLARYESESARVLDLLVLWRGAPGWFARGSNRVASGGSSTGAFHTTIGYGDLQLELDFDRSARIAQIQRKPVELHDDNVVLVDDVDSPGGPVIVSTLHIDSDLPQMDSGYPRFDLVLRRSPDIVPFLRCDVRIPDGRGQAIFDALCAQWKDVR
jgi:hypothetical protein